MNPNHPLVAQRADYRCEYCRAPEAIFNFAFEVEHIIPATRGGDDDPTNWALSCRACNLHKSDHVEGLDAQTGNIVRLFDPRHDVWGTHFVVDREGGAIEALTDVGRATVACLRLNTPGQIAARRQWMRLGLFP